MDRNTARGTIFPPTIDIHPADGTVRPTSDGSPCGRLSRHASPSVALPRTMTLTHRLFPLPFPSSQPTSACVGGGEHIDPGPDLGGRATPQMLMGPEVIVDRPCVHQRLVERGGIVNSMWHQQPFQGSDQALDPTVLPGTARLAVLQANARTPQNQTKMPRGEHRFVVSTQKSWVAILTACDGEVMPNPDRRFVRQSLHAQASAACMVQNGQHHVLLTGGIRLGQQVHAPDQIAGNGPRYPMFQCSSQTQDGMLLSSDRVGDVGFADGHLPTDREAPVEGVHDRAAACMGHKGFEPNDFVSHPTRFGWRMRPAAWAAGAGTGPGGPWSRLSPSTQPVPQLGTPSNEPAQSMQQHSPPETSWITKWMAM